MKEMLQQRRLLKKGHKLQGRQSWVPRVRICAPNIWTMSKKNVDFAHPIAQIVGTLTKHQPTFLSDTPWKLHSQLKCLATTIVPFAVRKT